MIRWFVEQEAYGLNEQGAGQRYAHAPTTGEVLGFLPLHLVRKAETLQDGPRPHFGRAGIERVQPFVHAVQDLHDIFLLFVGRLVFVGEFVGIFRHFGEQMIQVVGLLLQSRPLFVDRHDRLYGRDRVGWFHLFRQEEDIDRMGDGHRACAQGPEESRFSTTVATNETVPAIITKVRIFFFDCVVALGLFERKYFRMDQKRPSLVGYETGVNRFKKQKNKIK